MTLDADRSKRARWDRGQLDFTRGKFLARGAAAVAFAATISTGLSFVGEVISTVGLYPQPAPLSLKDKIEALTQSLNDSAKTISEIEGEIDQRRQLVAKLQQDADTAQHLAQINSAEANAIAQTMRRELEQESKHDFWLGALQNFFFTLLGFVLAEGFRYFRRWRRARKFKSTGKLAPLSDPPAQS